MPQFFETGAMEHYDNTMLNDMPWDNEYSPSVDNWLQTNADWPMFDTDLTSSPTTEMYIQPQALDMYNSPSSTISSSRTRNISTFSDVSSATTSLADEDDEDITPKQESICAPSPAAVAAAPRKRGRPRTVRIPEKNTYEYDMKSPKPSKRQPHNQVERKYREGLNTELEKLRLALPATRWEMSSGCGSGVKASKAVVLACAVAYIRDLEQERDLLRRENEMLKSGKGMRRPSYE